MVAIAGTLRDPDRPGCLKRLGYFYATAAVLCLAGVAAVLYFGNHRFGASIAVQEPGARGQANTAPLVGSGAASVVAGLAGQLTEAWPLLLLQLVTVVLATWSVAALFRRLGLPGVVGEITAGILLGPTLLGWIWPGAFALLFQHGAADRLKLFSQIGVVVFMFVAGTEFDSAQLRGNVRRTLILSQVGIFVPFVLGAVAALFLFPQYAGPRATFPAFTLFMAISLSITAFPVLVRMLQERRMMKSDLGSAALASAAIDDASAWTMLSLIIAFVTARGLEAAAVKLGALAVFVAATMLVVRPAMARWLPTRETTGEHFGDSVMAVVLLYMTLSALTTELLGVHALFGAFLAGVCMPRGNQFCEHLASRLAGFNRVLLLPLFFALSGARTQLGLLDGRGWCICGFITLLATIGKLGGCMTAARLGGMKWRQAFAFGALMNTRGLMELVVINLGYDLGILSPAIFSVLVVMAIVTTLLTGPLLALSERRAGKPWEGSPMPAYSRS